jgi:protein gp37
MGLTSIEWTDYTWNPWVGCTKVSPACDNCYAESWAKRTGQSSLWAGNRRRTTVANWREPAKWNRKAETSGIRIRVFCASLADIFDNQVDPSWRRDVWDLIMATQSLDWLLLTKRPQNIAKMLPERWTWPARGHLSNVWLGTTAENQQEADRRIPHLLSVPAAVHFLSCEPLLGAVHLPAPGAYQHHLDWVIVGGESGGKARLMEEPWALQLQDQCDSHGIAFFMKQMTRKQQIPANLMVRQFPTPGLAMPAS